MHILSVLAGLGLSAALLLPGGPAQAADSAPVATGPLAFTVKDIGGKDVPLSHYKGKVVMIVNTASLCGNTPQYAALETLYKKYQDRGLRILAFPANNFGQQEPGDNGSIQQFCTSKYQVTFDLFSKLSVAGADQAPLYKYLTDKATDPKFGGPIDWNFAKFLVNREGKLVARFPAGHSPLLPDVITAVEAELGAAK